MQLVVRPAEERDIPALLAIYNEAVLTTTATYDIEPQSIDARRAWFEERRAQGLPVFVAERGGRVVGWSALNPFRPRPGYRFTVENSVYVAGDARGQGVGAALLPPLVERARALGCHAIIAGIDAANDASLRLHARHGFEKVAHLKEVGWKFGRWLDVVYLQLTLPREDPPTP